MTPEKQVPTKGEALRRCTACGYVGSRHSIGNEFHYGCPACDCGWYETEPVEIDRLLDIENRLHEAAGEQ